MNVLHKRKRQVTYATPGASPAKRRPHTTQREGEESHLWARKDRVRSEGEFNSSLPFLSGLFSPSPNRKREEEERRRDREEWERAQREEELTRRDRERAEEEEHSGNSLSALLLPWATQKFSTARQPLQIHEETLEDEYDELESVDRFGTMDSHSSPELIELSSEDEAEDVFLPHSPAPLEQMMPYHPKALKPRPVFDDDGVFLTATLDPPDYLDSEELEEYRDLLEQEQAMRLELDRIRREAANEAKRDATSLLSKLEESAEKAFLQEQQLQEEGMDWEDREELEEEEDAQDEPGLSSWGLFSLHEFAGVPSSRSSQFKERMKKERKTHREQAIEESLEELRAMAEAHKKRMFERARDNDRWRTLTDEEEQAIFDATHGSEQEVVVRGFNMEIKRLDILKVTGTEWLGDEAINFYMNLLKEREERYPGCYLKCHFFNTFFYNMLSSRGYDYSRVRRWTLKFDVFALDKVIIPVHMGAHWCLSVINFRLKRVEYYDSMGGRNIECLKKLERYIQDEYQNKKKCGPYDMTGWKRYTPGHSVPQQANGYDCGMFMCKFADCSARGEEFDFSQRDMRYFRKRMILEIITKEATM